MRPINNLVGGCAIAVGIKEHTSISGSALRTVVDYLFQKMFNFSSCSLGETVEKWRESKVCTGTYNSV